MKLEEVLQTSKFSGEQHKASLNIMYTAYWIKTQVTAALKPFGLTSEQFNVLRILKGKYPTPMCNKDIAMRMIEKNSNVPRIADRLVLKKLVERNVSQEDKRETLLMLTETGIDLLEKANGAIDILQKNKLNLEEDEARQLNALLEKIRSDKK